MRTNLKSGSTFTLICPCSTFWTFSCIDTLPLSRVSGRNRWGVGTGLIGASRKSTISSGASGSVCGSVTEARETFVSSNNVDCASKLDALSAYAADSLPLSFPSTLLSLSFPYSCAEARSRLDSSFSLVGFGALFSPSLSSINVPSVTLILTPISGRGVLRTTSRGSTDIIGVWIWTTFLEGLSICSGGSSSGMVSSATAWRLIRSP